jgi:hypothetical protein
MDLEAVRRAGKIPGNAIRAYLYSASIQAKASLMTICSFAHEARSFPTMEGAVCKRHKAY